MASSAPTLHWNSFPPHLAVQAWWCLERFLGPRSHRCVHLSNFVSSRKVSAPKGRSVEAFVESTLVIMSGKPCGKRSVFSTSHHMEHSECWITRGSVIWHSKTSWIATWQQSLAYCLRKSQLFSTCKVFSRMVKVNWYSRSSGSFSFRIWL